MFPEEIAIHYPSQVLNRYSVPQLIEATALAKRLLGDRGFAQVWVADNPEYRQIYVVMGAIAARFPDVRMGTAVTSPYIRSAIDLADGFATLTELTSADEVSAGIGGGSAVLSGMFGRVKKVDLVLETIVFLKKVIKNEMADMREFPLLCGMNNLKPESKVTVRFKSLVPVKVYFGTSTYHVTFPRKLMPVLDGLIVPHTNLVLLGDGFGKLMEEAEGKRAESGVHEGIKKVLHLTGSISDDSRQAIDFSKRHVSHLICAIPDEKLVEFGIDVGRVNRIREVFKKGHGIDEAIKLTTDEMVRLFHISGTPAECIERIAVAFKAASKNDFQQVNIAVPVGPDLTKAIELWAQEILPSV